jgi:hypothetical protein
LLLTDVKAWLELGHSATGSFTVALYADNNTFPGNQLLVVGTLNDTSIATLPGQVYDFPVSPGFALTPNTRYWIGMTQSGSPTTSTNWAFTGSTSGAGNIANEYNCSLQEQNRLTSTTTPRSVRPHGEALVLTCQSNVTDPYLMQVTASPSTPTAAAVPTLSFTGVTMLTLLLAASAVLFLRRSSQLES